MDRRWSSRARVDIPICAVLNGFRHTARAVDLSVNGMVFRWPEGVLSRPIGGLGAFEIHLGGSPPVFARGRPVWSRDGLHAVRFVAISDADRLSLAEHLDRGVRAGARLH